MLGSAVTLCVHMLLRIVHNSYAFLFSTVEVAVIILFLN